MLVRLRDFLILTKNKLIKGEINSFPSFFRVVDVRFICMFTSLNLTKMKDSFKSILSRLEVFSLLYLAHHDSQDRCFSEHVFKIGSLYLCVGCTCSIVGLITWLILSSLLYINYFVALIVTFIGVICALVQLKLKLKKLYKCIFRFTLGIAIGAYLTIIINVEHFIFKCVLLISFIIGASLYAFFRRKFPNNYDECY